jgi:hypothetical protein
MCCMLNKSHPQLSLAAPKSGAPAAFTHNRRATSLKINDQRRVIHGLEPTVWGTQRGGG